MKTVFSILGLVLVATVCSLFTARAGETDSIIESIAKDDVNALKKALKYDKSTDLDSVRGELAGPEPLLHLAASFDSPRVIEWLIVEGVDLNLVNKDNRLAGEIALSMGNKHALTALKREPKMSFEELVYEYFLRKGVGIVKIKETEFVIPKNVNPCKATITEIGENNFSVVIEPLDLSSKETVISGTMRYEFGYLHFKTEKVKIP